MLLMQKDYFEYGISLFIVNNIKEKDDSQHVHEQLETSGVRNKAFVQPMCE